MGGIRDFTEQIKLYKTVFDEELLARIRNLELYTSIRFTV